jgi:hypothetical protein
MPSLTLARRTLTLDPATGEATIHDIFEFSGEALPIEEAFVTWHEVTVQGDNATIHGDSSMIELCAPGASFAVEALEKQSRENERTGILKRITAQVDGTDFTLRITPKE